MSNELTQKQVTSNVATRINQMNLKSKTKMVAKCLLVTIPIG